jgi:diaminopimelate decarboxylase
MRGRDGTMHLIRKKQSLEQILENEVELADDAC